MPPIFELFTMFSLKKDIFIVAALIFGLLVMVSKNIEYYRFEGNRKMKENIESNKEKLLDKTFSDDFLSTLPLRWVWVGKVDAVLPDGETCKAVKFSRSEGWGVKATTTEMLFVPQDEPNLSFEENYFDVYKTGFEGSDSLYKTIDFVSTSKLEEYLKENLNNMAEFFDAISKK